MMRRLFAAAMAVAVATAPLSPAVGAPAAAAAPCTVLLALVPGVQSTLVRCLEQRLVALGYTIGTPDNVYDPVSVAAVKSFQERRGLYPDGKVTSIAARQLGLRGTPPPPTAPKVSIIGDSTSAAMRWYDEANNSTAIFDIMGNTYDLQWSLESCRRLTAPSCIGRLDPGQGIRWKPVSVLPLMQTTMKGRLGDAVVVMAGYDDMPRLNDDINGIVDEAERQGVTRIFWLTYRTTAFYSFGGSYLSHNADLQRARALHPNLTVLDWNAYTHSQSAATQDAWFERDDVHMTRAGGTALAQFIKRAIDTSDVQACQTGRALGGTTAEAVGTPLVSAAPAGFTGAAPTRVYDSRSALLGGGQGKIAARRKVAIDLTGRVPTGATSAIVSITAASPCASGAVTAYGCGVRPAIAQLRFESGRTSTGTAIVPLTGSSLCVYTTATTDLRVDLNGTFGAGGDGFHTVATRRWLDTRGGPATVNLTGTLASGAALTVPVAGRGIVPADATGTWMNVTAIAIGSGGTLAVLPGACGTGTMQTATVSVHRWRSASAAALAALDGSGSICLRASGGPLHVTLDLNGWFGGAQAGALSYQAEAPTRVLGATTAARITPTTVLAATTGPNPVLNVAAIRATSNGSVGMTACGTTATSPLLTTTWSESAANVGVVGLPVDLDICFGANTTANLVVDRTGHFVG